MLARRRWPRWTRSSGRPDEMTASRSARRERCRSGHLPDGDQPCDLGDVQRLHTSSIRLRTVTIFSTAESDIEIPRASSTAIAISTRSKLSAPRSSMIPACSVILCRSTPRCSASIFFISSAIAARGLASQFGLAALVGRVAAVERGGAAKPSAIKAAKKDAWTDCGRGVRADELPLPMRSRFFAP